jgi:hypothetical protein
MSNKEDKLQEGLDKEKFGRVYDRIESNHNEVLFKLEKILEQTTKTNGRVTLLEAETRFIRAITRYPKIAVLAFIGLITLFNLDNILTVITRIF